LSTCYLDASALAKLILVEPESRELIDAIGGAGTTVVTSLLGCVEVERACARQEVPHGEVRRVLDDVSILSIDAAVAAVAGRIAPPSIRTLDAVHLATARALGADLDVMYCYDRRLAAAAAAVGIEVRSPGIRQ
jgi:uncharacterized protein